MRRLAMPVCVAALALAAASAGAQSQGQAQTPSQARPPTAATPPVNPAPGRMAEMGPGMGPGMGAGPQDTFGWGMMSAEERQAHMSRMHGFTSRKECEAYMARHHRAMADRARQQGLTMPAEPPRNACAGLK